MMLKNILLIGIFPLLISCGTIDLAPLAGEGKVCADYRLTLIARTNGVKASFDSIIAKGGLSAGRELQTTSDAMKANAMTLYNACVALHNGEISEQTYNNILVGAKASEQVFQRRLTDANVLNISLVNSAPVSGQITSGSGQNPPKDPPVDSPSWSGDFEKLNIQLLAIKRDVSMIASRKVRSSQTADIFFVLGSFELTAEAKLRLSDIISLRAGSAVEISITGYASSDGLKGNNVRLAKMRAEATASWLASSLKISPSKISYVGGGIENFSKVNNRRAVVTVTSEE